MSLTRLVVFFLLFLSLSSLVSANQEGFMDQHPSGVETFEGVRTLDLGCSAFDHVEDAFLRLWRPGVSQVGLSISAIWVAVLIF